LIDGEAGKVCMADAGEIGGGNTGAMMGGAQGQELAVEGPDDLGGQDTLAMLGVGV
jgi:hypothetical protein